MKNHFIISYAGNKRNEIENILNVSNFENINTIIEPFCGSCAVSYSISLKYPKKFKYILNDLNDNLIELMKIMKDKKKFDDFKKKINDIIPKIKDSKEEYLKVVKNKDIYGWFIANKYYNIRAGLYPSIESIFDKKIDDECPIINFLRTEDVEIRNEEGTKIIEEFKNDPHNYIFLDPPYLLSCNTFYSSQYTNVYEYIYNNNILNYNCFVVCALEDMWIIRLLFNQNINENSKTQNKTYQMTKTKTTHIYFNNKK